MFYSGSIDGLPAGLSGSEAVLFSWKGVFCQSGFKQRRRRQSRYQLYCKVGLLGEHYRSFGSAGSLFKKRFTSLIPAETGLASTKKDRFQ